MTSTFQASPKQVEADPSADSLQLAQLDTLIQQQQQHLVDLVRWRNSLVPITKIDDDILRLIFSYAVLDDDDEIMEPSEWLGFHLVCRRWHALLADSPQFYAQIDLTNNTPSALQQFLKRSQSYPLTVSAHLSTDCEPPIRQSLPLFQSHWARVESLALVLGPRTLEMAVSFRQLFDQTNFPALRVLLIASHENTFIDETGSPLSNSSLLISSPLQSFSLANIQVALNLNLLRGLKRLDLKAVRFESIEDLSLAFKSCSALQLLSIQHCVSGYRILESDERPQAQSFPHLKRLRLADQPKVVEEILARLSLPTTAQLDVKVSVISSEEPELSRLRRIVSLIDSHHAQSCLLVKGLVAHASGWQDAAAGVWWQWWNAPLPSLIEGAKGCGWLSQLSFGLYQWDTEDIHLAINQDPRPVHRHRLSIIPSDDDPEWTSFILALAPTPMDLRLANTTKMNTTLDQIRKILATPAGTVEGDRPGALAGNQPVLTLELDILYVHHYDEYRTYNEHLREFFQLVLAFRDANKPAARIVLRASAIYGRDETDFWYFLLDACAGEETLAREVAKVVSWIAEPADQTWGQFELDWLDW